MITVTDLSFSYSRRTRFIEDMSFTVTNGEIFGFLGPSGAGKSTVQKILTGILRQYRGSVRVLGREVRLRRNDFYEQIGVDFEFPNLYGKFTALENLRFFASLYGGTSADPLALLERVGLADDAHKPVSSYSKGMKMRLTFVRSILHQPSLIFLDEPTSGLDPVNARLIKNLIREQKQAGRTIILTTHNMHDAEELCDRVAFIADGKIRALDTPHALRARKSGIAVTYTYRGEHGEETEQAELATLHKNPAFLRWFNSGLLTGIHSKEPTLEDVFIELTGRCLQ